MACKYRGGLVEYLAASVCVGVSLALSLSLGLVMC